MLSNDQIPRVVIPARFGSQRLPGKPLVDLGGTPMIVRVYEAVRAAIPNSDVVVAVDDVRISSVLEARDIPVTMTSPECVSGTDRVAEVSRAKGWKEDDLVINVQGDEPLIPVEMLQEFALFCSTQPAFEMGTIAVPIGSADEIWDPNVVLVTTREDGSAITFSRAPIPFQRDLPTDSWDLAVHRRHVGIYAYTNRTLQRLTETPPCQLEKTEHLEQLRALWLGIDIQTMEWHSTPPGGVDTPDDVDRVRAHLQRTEA